MDRISFLYGSVWCNKRVDLWNDLTNLAPSAPNCWVSLGDFNVFLRSHKKIGRGHAVRPCRDFRDFIDSISLLQIPLRGAQYTWCNRHLGTDRVESLLDRSLASEGVFSFWQSINCLDIIRITVPFYFHVIMD